MRTNNSLAIPGFVSAHLLWGLISWIWYKNILFRCLPSLSFAESKLMLLVIIVLSCVIGMLFEIRNDRNNLSMTFNLTLAYGIYTVLTYIQIRKALIITCLSLAGALSFMGQSQTNKRLTITLR